MSSFVMDAQKQQITKKYSAYVNSHMIIPKCTSAVMVALIGFMDVVLES